MNIEMNTLIINITIENKSYIKLIKSPYITQL
jgi:hypothetical protein